MVKVDGGSSGRCRLRGRAFAVDVELPLRETTVRVETVDGRGRRAGRSVPHVFGLPRAARPRFRAGSSTSACSPACGGLARRFRRTAGVYVENLTTGAGAAWNARATFPAASTLKLAIAVTALHGRVEAPRHGSTLDGLLRRMLWYSDNAAANSLLVCSAARRAAAGALVNSTMRSIGLERTEMYGGYILGTRTRRAARGSRSRAVAQPDWGIGKRPPRSTSPSSIVRSGSPAPAGLGCAARTRASRRPRPLPPLPARARQPGSKSLARCTTAGCRRAPQGRLGRPARHDAGLVVWRGRLFVAAVMTYRPRVTVAPPTYSPAVSRLRR